MLYKGTWKEEEIMNVKMVLGVSGAANLVTNKPCTIANLVINKLHTQIFGRTFFYYKKKRKKLYRVCEKIQYYFCLTFTFKHEPNRS
jgi:hypothetical protein